MTGWEYPDCHDLKLSNRPVRTRMPGGVAGVQPIMAAPYADSGIQRSSSRVIHLFRLISVQYRDGWNNQSVTAKSSNALPQVRIL